MIKAIAVISGKGGTGKTTIVGSLAYLAKNKVVVDCDVDAADLHLILKGKTAHLYDFMGGQKAIIDPELCNDCGLCVEYCRFDAIKGGGNTVDSPGDERHIDQYECEGCAVCAEFCIENAIRMKDHKSGQWLMGKTKYGPLIHAKLGIAEANSGRLVSLLRRSAQELAKKNNYDLILIDGSPGIGCPVIATLTGVSYALIVTEPTVSAIHDMERLIELAGHFEIQTGICVNKCDLNSNMADKIERLAKRHKIPVLARIPYDLEMVKSQIKGVPFTEFSNSDTSKIISQLWQNLLADLSKSKMNSRIKNEKIININNPY